MASTKDRIIEAALALVSQRGLAEITMVDIARTAGIARQTLYNHFDDIPSILTEGAARHNQAAMEQLHQALAVVDTPTEVVRQLIRHIASISAHPGHTLDSHHELPPEMRQHLNGYNEALEQQLRLALSKGVDQGEFRADLSIDIDATLVRYLLNGLSSLVSAIPSEAPRIVAEVTRTTLAALQQGDQA